MRSNRTLLWRNNFCLWRNICSCLLTKSDIHKWWLYEKSPKSQSLPYNHKEICQRLLCEIDVIPEDDLNHNTQKRWEPSHTWRVCVCTYRSHVWRYLLLERSDNVRILLVWPYKREQSTPISRALLCGFTVLLLETKNRWMDGLEEF